MTKKILTLCLIYKNNQLLLGMKKRGFGQGRWNGFGGKMLDSESIKEAAIREIKEEVGLTPLNIKRRGILNFHFEGNPEILEVHIFSATDFKGQLIETEEMKPKWFNQEEIPYATMWPDDQYWLPLLLEGKNFRGDFYFRDSNTLLQHALEETGKLMHFSVGALITKSDQYLLIDRATPPLGFAGIAGHIDKEETEKEALIREVKEESGLKVENYKLLFEEELDWNWCSKGATCHYWYLFSCQVSGKIRKNPVETKSIGWYTKDEIKKLTLEPVWHYWFKKLNLI